MDTFRYHGKRLAVTITVVRVMDYLEPTETNKSKSRKMLIAIVRNAQTGTPYTGTAVLHPKEVKSFSYEHGEAIAVQRAFESYAVGEFTYGGEDDLNSQVKKTVKDMWRWYRIYTRTQFDDPDLFAQLVKDEQIKRNEERREMDSALEKIGLALDHAFKKAFGFNPRR